MDLSKDSILLWSMRAAALLSTLVILFRQTFAEDYSSLGGFFFLLASIFSIVYLLPNACTFTNSKGIQVFGAFGAVLIGCVIIGLTVNGILGDEDLDYLYNFGWNGLQTAVQMLLAVLAGAFLCLSSCRRISLLDRALIVLVIPVFIFVQATSSAGEISFFDGWTFAAVSAVVISTMIALAVLYFTDLQHVIVYPLLISLVATVFGVANVKKYLFPPEATESIYGLYAYSPEYNAVTILQLVVSVGMLAICLYLVWRTRFKTETA